ncbi:glycosyltransferase family 4 protein [Uliginosibacterium sp. sgz301328]|uniref:glycosyltransferase family 4 protein n=1 Tax=Uliginosibacterium sp. sgz301328 TaxID=3243764 RepID=UPI00359CF2CE
MPADLRVAAFTQGLDVPSARFRVRQYVSALAERGVALDEYPAAFGSYPPPGLLERLQWLPRAVIERRRTVAHTTADVALVQREMVSTLATAESVWRGPMLFDVDDAVWLHQRLGGADRIARRSNAVICGNAFIAEHFAPFARTVILPTAVDTGRYVPGPRAASPVLCWSGSSSGLPYLEALAPQLRQLMQAIPDATLRVISNAPPRLEGVPRVEYVRWSPETEITALQGAWCGLMPMPDTPWTRGKCSYKMLTYMACAVPAVVSPWGMNAEVLAQGDGAVGARDHEWADVLTSLLRDPARIAPMGQAGREIVQRSYAVDTLAGRLAQTLREVAAEGAA